MTPTTPTKTTADMEHRRSVLEGVRIQAQLSLREASELDAIGHGLDAWNEWLEKVERRRKRPRGKR